MLITIINNSINIIIGITIELKLMQLWKLLILLPKVAFEQLKSCFVVAKHVIECFAAHFLDFFAARAQKSDDDQVGQYIRAD